MQCLPVNGVPSGIMTVESDADIMSNEITSSDLGYTTDNDEEDTVYNQTSEMSSFMPVNEQQQQELEAIKDKLCPKELVNWPTLNNQPINEYQKPFLVTLAFPTLFPDDKGDPTDPSLLNEVNELSISLNLLKRLMENGFIDFLTTLDFLIGL